MISRVSIAAVAFLAYSANANAQELQTSDEKIEELEAKVERLEALVAQLLTARPIEAEADQTPSEVEPLAKVPPVNSLPLPPATRATLDDSVGGGTVPSQNFVSSEALGRASCAMRVFKNVDLIEDETAKTYFSDPTRLSEPESAFRLISPELAYAVREEAGRVAQCDVQQIRNKLPSRKGGLPAQAERVAEIYGETGIASAIPGRPLQLGGLRPTFELGKSSTATLAFSAPIYGRTASRAIEKDVDFDKDDNPKGVRVAPGFRPTIFSPFLEFSTPLSDGSGLIFTGIDDDDDDTEGVEFADKISIRAGFDWLNFRGVHYYETERAIDKLLNDSVKSCLRSVRAERDPTKPADGSDELICKRDRVIDWILAFKRDSSTRSGFAHKRAELAEQLANLMWRAPEKAVPTLGLGASIKYTTQDFKFRQASVTDVVGAEKITVVPDFGVPLAASDTKVTDNFEIEGHGLVYLDFMGHRYRKATPAGKIPGILFVPQFTYTSTYEFADGTKFTTCDFDPSARPATCSEIQIDRPRRRGLSSLSLEARSRMLNVPVFNQIGFAPKISYRLDDNGMIVDFPIYFATKGELSSGIRARYTSGLNDLLGNPLDDKWEVSIFFTPLTFTAFK